MSSEYGPGKISFVGLCKDCDHDACQIRVVYDTVNSKIDAMLPVPESPLQPAWGIEGCERPQAHPEVYLSNMRPTFPLKRKTGTKRGEGKWVKITYQRALDEIAEKLKELRAKYGPECLGIMMGWYNELWDAARFANLWGTGNIDGPWRYCWIPEAIIQTTIIGDVTLTNPSGPTQLAVLWGTGHAESSGIKWRKEKEIPHLIVVNPVPGEEVDYADIWLRVRPASDGALALAWLNIIINEELYDKEFVRKWTYGFDKLKERVKDWTPERAAEICWVSKNDIIDAARMYGTMKPAALCWGTSIGHMGWNAQVVEHARICLRAVTGNLGVVGGDEFRHIHPLTKIATLARFELEDLLSQEQREKSLGSDRFRVASWRLKEHLRTGMLTSLRDASWACMIDAAITEKPYPIKAVIMTNSPLTSIAGAKKAYDALTKCELVVSMASHWNPTAFIADYVIPTTHWYERPSISWLEQCNIAGAGWPGCPTNVPGRFERHTHYDVWKGIGERTGQEGYWPWKDMQDYYEYITQTGLRMSWKELAQQRVFDIEPIRDREYEKTGFTTPTGKVELYSTIFEKLNYDPLPYFEEPAESPYRTPELSKEYPLIMTSNHRVRMWFVTGHGMRGIRKMREAYPYPRVRMNSATAKKYGLNEGDWAWVESNKAWGARVMLKVKYEDRLDSNVIQADYGWWYPEMPWEAPSLGGLRVSNINWICSAEIDHLSKHNATWVDTGILVKVYKVDEKDIPEELKGLKPGRLDRYWATPPEARDAEYESIALKK